MGGFGIVYKAKRKYDGKEFAVKVSKLPLQDYLEKEKQDI
jgi:serine/threonine protein kinase